MSVPGGILIGSAAGTAIGSEIERLTAEAQKLMVIVSKQADSNLKAIKKSLKKHSRKHRKKNPDLAGYINVWVKEIDKRLKMGAKSYRKLARQYKKSSRSLKRLEERIL